MEETPRNTHEDDRVVWTIAALAGLVGALGVIGSDALWLVPLGAQIAHGRLPNAIAFATAPTRGWHDVPAGAQLVFWSAYRALGGLRGLVVLQTVAAAIGFGALAHGLRRQATAGAAALVSLLVLAASLPAVVVVGVSLFSLALFPILLALLESETRAPSRRLWLAVPLLAVWGNLHGEALAGLGLLACYLVADRARREPLVAASVLVAATVALFLNPELERTPQYYTAVLHSVVARAGSGLWAPLGTGLFDLVLVAAAAVLVALAVRGRSIHLWEGIALLGLAAATVHVARTGTWFVFVAAYPAARPLRLRAPRRRLLAVATLVLVAAATALIGKGPADPGSAPLAARAARTDGPVLADAVLGQQVVLAGGRVWVDNPVDAFRRADQQLYVDWLDGKPSGAVAVSHAEYVLVEPSSRAGRRAADDSRLRRLAARTGAVLYRVVR